MKRTRHPAMISDDEVSFDLDLAPMLAMMVTLIPILLVSTVFVKSMVIETTLPQAVIEALDNDRKNEENKIRILLKTSKKMGFEIEVTKGENKETHQVVLKKGLLDFESLHKQMVKIKQTYPEIFTLELTPDEMTSYKEIVQIMDEVRNRNKNDPKIFILDKKDMKNVEMDLMFPNVEFANLLAER